MLLQQGEYEIELDNTDLKKIIVKVKYSSKTFKTILPKTLNKHGFGKYNIPIKLYNLIILNTYQLEYNENQMEMYLIFSNIIFEPDNKIYNDKLIVNLEEYIDYQNYNMDTIIKNLDNIDLELAKKIIVLNYNQIRILERKMKKKIIELEDKIDLLKSKSNDYNYDYENYENF